MGNTSAYNNTLDTEVVVPLKYLSNIWRFLDFPSVKVGLSPSKKISVICFIKSPLKTMENTFYFTSKAFFVLNIFKFLS